MFITAGSEVGGYALHEKVGQGSFGTVFTCEERATGEVFVMKMMDVSGLSARDREACLTEIKVLATLTSLGCPYIIRYEGSFLEDSTLCVVMEYAGGGNLQQKIRASDSGLPDRTLWTLFIQIALALHVVHQAGILHRDLKAANVFLTSSGDVRLGDFGLSKVLTHPASLAKSLVGTPYYLSPEMCNGKEYDSTSDIWALGVVLYEMATASFPFQASNQAALVLQIMRCKVSNKGQIVKKYGVGVWELIAACLKKAPTQRPSLVQLLAHAQVVDRATAFGIPMPKEVEEEYRRCVVRQIRANPIDSVASVAPGGPPQPARGTPTPTKGGYRHPASTNSASATASSKPPPPQPGMIPSRRVRRGAPKQAAASAAPNAPNASRRVPTALRHMPPPTVGARPFTPHDLAPSQGAGANPARPRTGSSEKMGCERLYYQSRPPPPEPQAVHTRYKSRQARERDVSLVAGLPEIPSSDEDDGGAPRLPPMGAATRRGSATAHAATGREEPLSPQDSASDSAARGRPGAVSAEGEVDEGEVSDEGSYTDQEGDGDGDGYYSEDPDHAPPTAAAQGALEESHASGRTSYADADEFVTSAAHMDLDVEGCRAAVDSGPVKSVTWAVKGDDGVAEHKGATGTDGFTWTANEDVLTSAGSGGEANGAGDREAVLLEQLLSIEEELAACGHDNSTLGVLYDMLEVGESASSLPEMTPGHVLAIRLLYRKMLVEAELKEYDRLEGSQ